jgi:4-hydroxyproline epimerase
MCGHGTIGLGATLAWLGRIGPGVHAIDTPVGPVQAELHADEEVAAQESVDLFDVEQKNAKLSME